MITGDWALYGLAAATVLAVVTIALSRSNAKVKRGLKPKYFSAGPTSEEKARIDQHNDRNAVTKSAIDKYRRANEGAIVDVLVDYAKAKGLSGACVRYGHSGGLVGHCSWWYHNKDERDENSLYAAVKVTFQDGTASEVTVYVKESISEGDTLARMLGSIAKVKSVQRFGKASGTGDPYVKSDYSEKLYSI